MKPNYLAYFHRHGNLTLLPHVGILWVMVLMVQDTSVAFWSYAQSRSGITDIEYNVYLHGTLLSMAACEVAFSSESGQSWT